MPNLPNHRWTRDDEIISLSAYFRFKDGEDKNAAIKWAVKHVNCRTVRDGVRVFDKPGSMWMKFQNWQYLDTDGAAGRPNVARKSIAIWEQYACDRKKLEREMQRIIRSFKK